MVLYHQKKEERGQVQAVFQLSLLGASMPILCSTPPRCLCLAGQASRWKKEYGERLETGKITVSKTALLRAGAASSLSSAIPPRPPNTLCDFFSISHKSAVFPPETFFEVHRNLFFFSPHAETGPQPPPPRTRQCGRAAPRNVRRETLWNARP